MSVDAPDTESEAILTEDVRIPSGDLELHGHLSRPATLDEPLLPGVVISHGFPNGPTGGANSPATFPELADRLSREMGWVALLVHLRGMPGSEGSFSLPGWRDDVVAAGRFLYDRPDVGRVWCVGFGTGGALSIVAAEVEERISGAAAVAAPADFADWAENPKRLLLHARDAGLVGKGDDLDFDTWKAGLSEVSAISAAENLLKPMLVVHGSEDEVVPSIDARILADAHGDAELRIVEGAGHHLRYDPRAVAVLLGWLDRQRRFAADD